MKNRFKKIIGRLVEVAIQKLEYIQYKFNLPITDIPDWDQGGKSGTI